MGAQRSRPRRSDFRLNALTGAVRGQIAQHSASNVKRSQFDIETAQQSLGASPVPLRTDCIDVLFLHGPERNDLVDDKLFKFLEANWQ